MRCVCCNTNLNNYESTLRGALTGDFLDMCRKCLKNLDIKVLPNANDPDESSPEEDTLFDLLDQEDLWINPIVDYE